MPAGPTRAGAVSSADLSESAGRPASGSAPIPPPALPMEAVLFRVMDRRLPFLADVDPLFFADDDIHCTLGSLLASPPSSELSSEVDELWAAISSRAANILLPLASRGRRVRRAVEDTEDGEGPAAIRSTGPAYVL
mmetsp:Transcript_28965/g.44718  ORF Transcript_28965/g.44718 Transcript_28965/m.44718 type:complete len:136 (+) Transcript_28965:802-1209(+)